MDISRLSASRYRNMAGTLCINDDVIMLEKTHSLFNRNITFQLNHVCAALIRKGSADFLVDGTEYHVKKNDLFVIIQQQEVRKINQSDDFEAHVLLMSREYIDALNIPNAVQLFLRVQRDPIIHLKGADFGVYLNCFNMIISTLHHTNNPFQEQIVRHLIKAYMYRLAYNLRLNNYTPQSREEDVCLQFIRLLEQYYKEQHSVSFYAKKMNLTARYVSSCVKTITSKTAIATINEMLLQHAQQALKERNKTISEISYELGFTNPSVFGKFFRTHMQIGPREWRENNRESSANGII